MKNFVSLKVEKVQDFQGHVQLKIITILIIGQKALVV